MGLLGQHRGMMHIDPCLAVTSQRSSVHLLRCMAVQHITFGSSLSLVPHGDTIAELATPYVPQEAWDLLSRCLEVDPARRFSAAQALQHSFLRD
jgi:serine/threonine protein kinase